MIPKDWKNERTAPSKEVRVTDEKPAETLEEKALQHLETQPDTQPPESQTEIASSTEDLPKEAEASILSSSDVKEADRNEEIVSHPEEIEHAAKVEESKHEKSKKKKKMPKKHKKKKATKKDEHTEAKGNESSDDSEVPAKEIAPLNLQAELEKIMEDEEVDEYDALVIQVREMCR